MVYLLVSLFWLRWQDVESGVAHRVTGHTDLRARNRSRTEPRVLCDSAALVKSPLEDKQRPSGGCRCLRCCVCIILLLPQAYNRN